MAKGAFIAPALHHIAELRRRLLFCVIVFAIGSVAGFVYRGQIIEFLQQPLGQQLFYTSPQGSFDFVMRVSMLSGLILTIPVLVYNILAFIEPALSKALGRKLIFSIMTVSAVLTLSGAAFAYYLGLPTALHFFGDIGTEQLKALISADRYFSFVLSYLATFAIVFHLPLILLLINHITPLSPGMLGRKRKWVIAGSFGLALLIPSVPDPMSQAILAMPLILLFEVSIWLIWLKNYVSRKRAAKIAPVLAQTQAPPIRASPGRSVPARSGGSRPYARPAHGTYAYHTPASPRVVARSLRSHTAGLSVIDLSTTAAVLQPANIQSHNIIDLRTTAA